MEPSRPPTLKEVQHWLWIYDFFDTHEKATIKGYSSIDFENDLKKLGQEVWGTESVFEIVEHLKEIAEAGKVVDREKALVPPNIDELVSEHLAAQQKRVQEPKPDAGRPTRQSIGEWLKEQRLKEIREALQTIVGKENAQGVAPLFESRLMEIATKMEMATKEEVFTEDQLRELVSSTLLEAAPQIANRETAEEVATNIAKTSLGRRILPKGIKGIEAIGGIRPVKVPQLKTAPKGETAPREDTKALREAQLLLRVSYLRASVVKQFFSQLGTLSPLRLLNIVGGTSYANSHPLEAGVQSLLLRGITIRLLRGAMAQLKEQHPEISPTDPRVRTLEEIITAMETYQSSHPSNYENFERRAADSVEIATPGEEVSATPGKMLRLRSIFDQAGKFQFLRIDTLSLKKGIRALPGIIGRAVSYPFLYATRIFFGRPAGGILHAFGGPRAVAVQQATFGIQKGLVNFVRGAFRQLGSFASDVFTRPALGWLRWGLTGGFGLGALILPFPFNFLSGGMAGLTGATQLAHSAPNAGSFLSGLARLRGGAGSGTGAGPSRFALRSFPMIALAPILIIPVLAFMVINGAQGTFLGMGGAPTSGPRGYIGSAYIEIQKQATPPGPFANTDIGKSVEYTIVIKPKGNTSSLTDVVAEDSMAINSASGTQTSQGTGLALAQITKDSPGRATYSIILEDKHKDSLITNTVSVSAVVPETEGKQTGTFSYSIIVGNPPEECPRGWPTEQGVIRQGPNGSFSHKGIEAIDISGDIGTPVHATHTGVARRNCDPAYGNCVTIENVCQGKTFTSLYAHLQNYGVTDGQSIKAGDLVGGLGATVGPGGILTGPHLHYEFRGLSMDPPLIPSSGLRGCSDNCAVSW
ncbi:MAG: peptidoglycan DD-metalloendopeptidase family protein [bacterium]|nr:peptidoglycan DD-metalloendopeptidase family protein [bacterium]